MNAKKEFDSALKRYYAKIKSLIVCDGKEKRMFLRQLKSRINEFINENDVCSIETVTDHFGKPEEIANSFFEKIDLTKIKKSMNIKKVVLAAVTAALCMFAVFLIMSFIDGYASNRGYYIEEKPVEEAYEGVQFYEEGN